jgi:hypothetical protein
MTTDETRKVAELLKDERIAVLTTTAPDGTLMSRPMSLQEVEFDGDLWFFASRSSRKVAHVTANPQVNVATSGSSSCGTPSSRPGSPTAPRTPTWCCSGWTPPPPSTGTPRVAGSPA